MLNVKQASEGAHYPDDMLTRFHSAIGRVGRLRARPYRDRRPDRKPLHMWYAYDHDARRVVELLWPWLGASKRQRWLDCLEAAA